MPDNWAYVFAAYGLAAAALIGYWRSLARRARRARDAASLARGTRARHLAARPASPGAGQPAAGERRS